MLTTPFNERRTLIFIRGNSYGKTCLYEELVVES